MQTTTKTLIISACVFCFCTYVYNNFVVLPPRTAYRLVTVTVNPGDTFEGIIGDFYDGKIAGESWEDWKNKQHDINYKLFTNGRILQPGDVITIETKVKIK